VRLLAYNDLKSLKGIGYSRAHLWRLVKAGSFPRPTKIGGGRNAWVEPEVDAYIKARITARDQSIAA
jgi:prophage regulatory protein